MFQALFHVVHEARRTVPSVLYIPHLTALWRDVMNPSLQAAFLSMVRDIPPTAPLLILAVMEKEDDDEEVLDAGITQIFDQTTVHEMSNPSAEERADFFRPVFEAARREPSLDTAASPTEADDELPVVPLADVRKLTEKEEKRLRRKEDAKLRELRIFLRYT